MFHLLFTLFLIWIVFTTLSVLRRERDITWILAPVVILPFVLVSGGVLFYFVSLRMLADTLGTTGDRLDWIIMHVDLRHTIVGYSAFIVGLGFISSVIGCLTGFRTLIRARADGGANNAAMATRNTSGVD